MTKSCRHILAISNSAALFTSPDEEPRLARYLMTLTCKQHPVVYHVGAANGDSQEKTQRFFNLARRNGFQPRHLNLFALQDGDPTTFFTEADAIYIDGGSTRNLRAILAEWSADQAIAKAYERGVVLCGASAGANIMFEWGMTDSIKTKIEATRGIGLLSGSLSVHADVRTDRNEALMKHLSGPDAAYPAFMLDDYTALHFADGRLHRAISTRTNAQARYQSSHIERIESCDKATVRSATADTI